MPNVTDNGTAWDFWGDVINYIEGEVQGSLYFYYLNANLIRGTNLDVSKAYNQITIPPTDAVQSVTFNPYLTDEDVLYQRINYDFRRFPVAGTEEGQTDQQLISNVFRIHRMINTEKALGRFKRYKPTGRTLKGERNWRNEGKLYQYPYMTLCLHDGISDPMEIIPHECHGSNEQTIKVKVPLSNFGTYSLYLEKYKGDTIGNIEGNINIKSTQMPISSSAYTNYMSTTGSQLATGRAFNLLSTIGAVTAGVATATTGIGTLAAGAALYNGSNNIFNSLAMEKDLRNTPNSMKTMGTDSLFGIRTGNKHLNLIRFKLYNDYMNKIGDYFAMFGYKQNKLMKPDLRSRYYYNYIKMLQCNISGEKIPKEHLEKIKDIYENGVTIWHMDRAGVKCMDYSKDNYEVN